MPRSCRSSDGCFDVALCGLGLMYVPDPVRALGEMRRVLRPGGRAAVAVWGARRACGWAEIFPITDARVASDVCPMFFQLGTQDMLARAFAAAGFADIRGRAHQRRCSHYASAEEALAAVFRGGPVALAYSRFDDADQTGGPCRISRFHRRLCGRAMATGSRASSSSPPPGRPCRKPRRDREQEHARI